MSKNSVCDFNHFNMFSDLNPARSNDKHHPKAGLFTMESSLSEKVKNTIDESQAVQF